MIRSFTSGLLAWLSGVCLALGLFVSAGALLRWDAYDYGPPRAQYLLTALVLGAARLALRPWLRTGRVRNSVANNALLVSLVLLVVAAFPLGYARTQDAAARAAMKSDLRVLMLAEEGFRRDSGRYSPAPPLSFVTSSGVTAPTVVLTPDGWTASLGHQRSRRTCVIYVGSTRIAPATNEGEAACAPPPFDPRTLLFIGVLFGAVALFSTLAVALRNSATR